MPIAKMEKVNIFSLISHKNEILDFLQKKGILEVRALKEKGLPKDLFTSELGTKDIDFELELAEIEFAINFLRRMEVKKAGMAESLLPPVIQATEEDLFLSFKDFDYKAIIKKCKSIDREITNLKSLEVRLIEELARILPWGKLNLALEDISETDKTGIALGIIGARQFSYFDEKLKRLSQAVHIEAVNKTNIGVYMMIVFLKEERNTILDFLKKSEFEEVSLPISHRTPKEEISHIRALLKDIKVEMERLVIEGGRLVEYKFKLMCAYDYLLQKKVFADAKDSLLDSKYTFILEGWVKAKDFNVLKSGFKEISDEIECVKTKAEKGEEPPVVIKNASSLRPLETITKIYGLPRYSNIDPTPLLSAFFILFFGLCLGDAGYGLTLALVSFIISSKFPIKESTKNLIKLLMYGGLASAVVGMFTGGWFGINIETLPAYLSFLKSIRLIDPVKNPLIMLVLALSLGVFQILFGIAVQMYINIRDNNYLDAVLDNGLWIYFIGCVIFYGLVVSKVIDSSLLPFAKYMALIGAGLLVVTQGRKQKNIFLKLGVGVLSLYKLVGYFSDVLSYSRLLALGLATTVIAMVINLIGAMTKGSIPILGYVIMLAIYIVGHTFNIAINVLGAFIHSGRLQFVEFFSKFLEGGGKEFKPFKRETKYVNLT